MKNCFPVLVFLCSYSAALAQSENVQTRRDNFHANDVAVQPDASQIINETPAALLRASGTAVMPTAEQISTTTAPELQKAAPGTVAVQPDASQIIYTTPPELRKKTAGPQPAGSAPKK